MPCASGFKCASDFTCVNQCSGGWVGTCLCGWVGGPCCALTLARHPCSTCWRVTHAGFAESYAASTPPTPNIMGCR
jgi:hypothetical protein